MWATARAEVAAEDFYKPNTPFICAAHIVGIADPVKYRKRQQAVEFFKRQQEDWTAQLRSNGPSLKELLKDVSPAMYRHNSNNSQQAIELRNKELKRQREEDQVRGLQDGKRKYQSDLNHTEDKQTKVGELKDQIRAIQDALRNAQDTLAYQRAKFHAECAARNIRTTEESERMPKGPGFALPWHAPKW